MGRGRAAERGRRRHGPGALSPARGPGREDGFLDIGGHGALPGRFDGVHQIDVDQEGNLYVTEVANDRSQMFRPKPKADPAKLIRPMVGRSRK